MHNLLPTKFLNSFLFPGLSAGRESAHSTWSQSAGTEPCLPQGQQRKQQVLILTDCSHLEHKWKGHHSHLGAELAHAMVNAWLLPLKAPPHGWSPVAADSLAGLGAWILISSSSLSPPACEALTL